MPPVFVMLALQAGAASPATLPVLPSAACVTEAQLAVFLRDAGRYGRRFVNQQLAARGTTPMCDGRSVASYVAVLRQGNADGELPLITPPATVAPRPIPAMATFTTRDAPFEIRFEGLKGRITHELTINGLGEVERCAGIFPGKSVSNATLSLAQKSCNALSVSGQFTPPLAADRKPTVSTVRYIADWQPAPYGAAVRPPSPRGDPAGWITSDDVPPAASGREGLVRVQLLIAPDGRPRKCTVISSSTIPALDDGTCRLLSRRGRFMPSVDAANEPTVGYFEKSVRWR